MTPPPRDRAAPFRSVNRVLLALGAILALLGSSLAFAAPAAQQRDPHTVYLPLVRGGQGTAPGPGPTTPVPPTPVPPTPVPPTPVPPQRGARFLEPVLKHASADLALDANGGMHAAYAHFIPNAEHPRAVYTFCTADPSGCADAAAWQSVALGDRVREVQLELTAQGQPRLLIVSDEEGRDGQEYYYAACDQNCGNFASWSSTLVVTSYNATSVTDADQPQRSFALDPAGRPAFLYNDRNYHRTYAVARL